MLYRCHPAPPRHRAPTRAGNPFILLLCLLQGCWASPRNQQGWFRSLKSVKAASEKDGRFTLPFKKGCKTRMLCHWPVGQHSASQQCPAPRLVARSEYLALVFLLNSTTGFADAMRSTHSPRLGPPGASTSPESGLAVSTYVNFLSREKR